MKGSNILAFIGGAIVGGAIALLFAPKSDEEIREEIKDFLDKEMKAIKSCRCSESDEE